MFLLANIAFDASGRAFTGVVDFPAGTATITAGEFEEYVLGGEMHKSKKLKLSEKQFICWLQNCMQDSRERL